MNEIAYLAGVVKGDAYIGRERGKSPRFIFDTTSKEFMGRVVQAFKILGFSPKIHELDRERTWIHPKKTYCFKYHSHRIKFAISESLTESLERFVPETKEEKQAFVAGFFQSEGTMRIQRYPNRICYMIRIYNTSVELLEKVRNIISEFGIETTLRNYHYHVPFLDIQTRAGYQQFLWAFGGK